MLTHELLLSRLVSIARTLSFRALVRHLLMVLLVIGALMQGASLGNVVLPAATEESKSAPQEGSDDEAEGPVRTLFLAAQTCHRRLVQIQGKASEFVRPLAREAYSERISQAVFAHAMGAGIHVIPLRC